MAHSSVLRAVSKPFRQMLSGEMSEGAGYGMMKCMMWGWLLFYVVLLLQALGNLRHPPFDAICTSRNTRTAKLGQQAMFSEGLQRPLLTDLYSGFEDQDISKPAKWTGKLEMGEEQHCQQIPCASLCNAGRTKTIELPDSFESYTKRWLRYVEMSQRLLQGSNSAANASVHDLFGNIWGDFGPQTTYLAITERLRRTRADLLFFLRLLYTGQAADETLFCVLPFRQWDMRIMNSDIDFNMCNPL